MPAALTVKKRERRSRIVMWRKDMGHTSASVVDACRLRKQTPTAIAPDSENKVGCKMAKKADVVKKNEDQEEEDINKGVWRLEKHVHKNAEAFKKAVTIPSCGNCC